MRSATRPPPGRVTERLAGAALLAAVAVGAAFVLFPGGDAPRIPGDDALGQPAAATVRASRDFTVPDDEATRRRREEAAGAEPRVYDHDLAAEEEAEARVREAFQLMRATAAQWKASRGIAQGRRETAAEAAELSRVLASRRAEFASRLQLWVDDADFSALDEARFAEPLEDDLVSLTRQGLEGLVVEDRALLAADRERGVRVREVRAGEIRGERAVANLSELRDLEGAREGLKRAAGALPGRSAKLRAALGGVGEALLRPTLALSQAETERRRQIAAGRVSPVVIPVRRGEAVLVAGERIEPHHLVVLRGMREQERIFDRTAMRVGAGLLVGATLLVLWVAAASLGATLRPRRRGAILLAGLYLATLASCALGLAVGDALDGRLRPMNAEAFSLLVPAPAGSALAAMLLSPTAGVLLAVAVGAAAGLLGGQSVLFGLSVTLTSFASALLVGRVQRRRHVWRAGVAIGALNAALVACGWLFAGRLPLWPPPTELVTAMGTAFLSGALFFPLAVVTLLPLLESVLDLASDLRLRDLASLNHPALKELIVQAPGTWHHSVVTGALAEAAARAIGADPLLARVGAYYHDLGKGKDPGWFSENTRGENPHAELPPTNSALLVKRHVEDGVELARRWKLPRPVVDIVAQHHGTRLVSFFWAKEKRAAGGERMTEVEAIYRYAGPKPQTCEAALVMIADSCEASSRDLPEATPDKLAVLVRRRIGEIVDEGQLDECDLTLRDLEAAARAMVEVLDQVYRTRSGDGAGPAVARPTALQVVRP
ncbi:MAG TPA: HDIG domain-containing protein [Anaeromyxobacteraceae bacterium]|nr:HDIG domain-containing protein [Anaeromyxobacteraceae bacterium]